MYRSMSTGVLHALPCALTVLLWASPGYAQYKNMSFGFDIGGTWVTKPTILDDDGTILAPKDRPLRLAFSAPNITGETTWKLDHDHWWFTVNFGLGFLRHVSSDSSPPIEREYDKLAYDTIGTIMSIRGGAGIRYYILTDKVRPYIQGALSYMHLLSFDSGAGSGCTVDSLQLCVGGGSNYDNFLSHRNLLLVHGRPGIEFIVTRDVALHLYADMQWWVVINAADNFAVQGGIGVTFYGG